MIPLHWPLPRLSRERSPRSRCLRLLFFQRMKNPKLVPSLSAQRRRILLSLTIACLQASASAANPPILPPLESFFADPPRFTERLSPDGKKVAYLGPDGSGTIQLWVVAVTSPDLPQRISPENGHTVRCLFWLPVEGASGSFLPPASPVEGASGSFLAPNKSHPSPSRPDESSTGTLLWQSDAPHGRTHLFFTDLRNHNPTREILLDETRNLRLEGVVTGEAPSVMLGISDTPSAFPDLYRVSLRENALPILAHRNQSQILTWAWDQTGTPVAGLRWTHTGSKELLTLREDPARVIFQVEPTDDLRLINASSDGTKALVITNRDSNFTQLEWIDLATGHREKAGSDPHGRVDLEGLLTAGDDILATSYSDQSIRWHAADPAFSATLQRIQNAAGHDSLDFHGIDESRTKILFKRFSATDPGSTWLYDTEKANPTLLWNERPDLHPAALSESRAIEYPARDGTRIPAYLTIPKDTSTPMPLVVFPHGGPRMRTHGVFDGRAQFLASRGYLVLQPNFRGSRGYGKAFMNAGDGQWGRGVMQTDVSDGVANLVRTGRADPDRVAIFGGSYGGYASLAGLVFTPDLYAAGICLFGISDLESYANHRPPEWEAYAGDTIRHIGNPHTDAGRRMLADLSPLNHATAFKAPLLIYHGTLDPLIPVDHALRMTRALQHHGKSVDLLLAPDEPHGFTNPESEMAVYHAIEIFLHQHLGGHLGPAPQDPVKSRLENFRSSGSP
jgi:dipeptidyl aminopeptidase/acylaminoacyl peptidase